METFGPEAVLENVGSNPAVTGPEGRMMIYAVLIIVGLMLF